MVQVPGDLWVQDFFDIIAPPSVPSPPPVTPLCDHTHTLLVPFTENELRLALQPHRGTSPGHDNIIYDLLYFLPPRAFQCLLDIYNLMWPLGPFPDSWHGYIIVPILKPGRDPQLATSRRGIALSSCFLKTL